MTTRKAFLKERIKQYRLDHRWSQEEFARRTGINVRTVKRAEAGEPLAEQTVFDIERLISEKEAVA